MSWDPSKHSLAWRYLSASIKKRADFKCENCGNQSIPGKKFFVYHIDLNKENNNLRNLVYLCEKCYLKIKAGYEPGQLFLLKCHKPEWAKKRETTLMNFNRSI